MPRARASPFSMRRRKPSAWKSQKPRNGNSLPSSRSKRRFIAPRTSRRVLAESRSGSAYATAFVNPRLAERLKGGESATLKTHGASYEARVWRIDPVSKEAVNNVEAILQILDPQNTLKVGEFVSGSAIESGAEETVLTIPRSAVLETATGKFTFVQNGDYCCAPPSPSERRTRSMPKLPTGSTLAMSSSRSPSRPSTSSSCAPPKAAGTLTKP